MVRKRPKKKSCLKNKQHSKQIPVEVKDRHYSFGFLIGDY